MQSLSRFRTPPSRRGQALVEFAMIAAVSTFLVAAILSFAILIHQANVLQMAVDVGAQELSRIPLPPNIALGTGHYEDDSTGGDSAFEFTAVREQLFDERFLVIDSETDDLANQPLDEVVQRMPLLNRLLFPVYVRQEIVLDRDDDPVTDDPHTITMFRYPGTLLRLKNTTGRPWTVKIPIVDLTDPAQPVINFISPVEEITWTNPDRKPGSPLELLPFCLDPRSNPIEPDPNYPHTRAQWAAAPEYRTFSPGVVALRINYPHQSATLSASSRGGFVDPYRIQDTDPQAVRNIFVVAQDPTPDVLEDILDVRFGAHYEIPRSVGFRRPITDREGNPVYAADQTGGDFRYNSARLEPIRPYRKVISVQAIYRREVFGE